MYTLIKWVEVESICSITKRYKHFITDELWNCDTPMGNLLIKWNETRIDVYVCVCKCASVCGVEIKQRNHKLTCTYAVRAERKYNVGNAIKFSIFNDEFKTFSIIYLWICCLKIETVCTFLHTQKKTIWIPQSTINNQMYRFHIGKTKQSAWGKSKEIRNAKKNIPHTFALQIV